MHIPLHSLGIPKRLLNRLCVSGFYTTDDIPQDLHELLDISTASANRILKLCESQTCCPILSSSLKFEVISCGIPCIDKLLNGGFPIGSVSEISGPTGMGKTQILFKIVSQYPKVKIIDLQGTLASKFPACICAPGNAQMLIEALEQVLLDPYLVLVLDNFCVESTDLVLKSRLIHTCAKIMRQIALKSTCVIFTTSKVSNLAATTIQLHYANSTPQIKVIKSPWVEGSCDYEIKSFF